MKAKTNLQKQVVQLSRTLPALSDNVIDWGYTKCLYKYAVRSRNTLYCLECGHSWKDESVLMTALEGCECPDCGNSLKMKTTPGPKFEDTEYYAVLTVKEGFQVVRMFCLKKYMKKNEPAVLFSSEVMQHWISVDGSITTLEKQVRGFSYYYDLWMFETDLEVRTKTDRAKMRQGLNPWRVHPKRKVLPEIRRNGFKGHFYGLCPHYMFSRLLSISKYETLLKSNQIELVKKYIDEVHNIVKYWNAIKICIRNNYIIKDPSMYFDYLDLLQHFNKDLHSPKYLCPDDFMRAHDRLVEKKRNIERKQKLKEQLDKIKKHQEIYEKLKSPYFGLQFQDGNLVVRVIESVKEFFDEGDYHRHCVYTNEYYLKKDSLVFSAKVEGVPVETVEVSLSELTVKQSRGRGNKATRHHQKILRLLSKNMHQIKDISVKAKKSLKRIPDKEKSIIAA